MFSKRQGDVFDGTLFKEVLEFNMLSARGRIGRWLFWKRVVSASILFGGLEYGMMGVVNSDSFFSPVFICILGAAVGLHAAFLVIQGIKRLHDFDRPGRLLLLNLTVVPIPLFMVWLGFFPGTNGPNSYDEDLFLDDDVDH